MTLELAIILLGGLFFASLLAIALLGELRSDHPWRRFAERRDLTYRRLGSNPELEGTYRGREIRARGVTDAEEPRTRVAVRVRMPAGGGDRAAEGAAQRLDELQRAEPRLQYDDDRIVYDATGLVADRRSLADLFDRMVDTARYMEGTL